MGLQWLFWYFFFTFLWHYWIWTCFKKKKNFPQETSERLIKDFERCPGKSSPVAVKLLRASRFSLCWEIGRSSLEDSPLAVTSVYASVWSFHWQVKRAQSFTLKLLGLKGWFISMLPLSTRLKRHVKDMSSMLRATGCLRSARLTFDWGKDSSRSFRSEKARWYRIEISVRTPARK